MTSEGAEAAAQAFAGGLAGQLVIRDSSRELGRAEPTVVTDAGVVTITAEFGPQEAVGEWAERQIVTNDGVVVDSEQVDLGRKAPGTIWALEATIDFNPQP